MGYRIILTTQWNLIYFLLFWYFKTGYKQRECRKSHFFPIGNYLHKEVAKGGGNQNPQIRGQTITMVERKGTKMHTNVDITLHRKLTIKQHEPN